MTDKTQVSDPATEGFTGWKHLKLCILTALTLKVTISSLFRLITTFALMFGSPISRVLISVTAIVFFQVLFIWPHKFTTRLLYYLQITVMCSVMSLGPLQNSIPSFISDIYSYYYYSIMIIILSFSKYMRLRQYHNFPFILRNLRHI